MNVKQIALFALIAAAGSSTFAAEYSEGPTGVSTLSRAAVAAEVAQARAAGVQVQGGEGGQQVTAAPSLRSRDEVRAEARAVRTSTAHLYAGA